MVQQSLALWLPHPATFHSPRSWPSRLRVVQLARCSAFHGFPQTYRLHPERGHLQVVPSPMVLHFLPRHFSHFYETPPHLRLPPRPGAVDLGPAALPARPTIGGLEEAKAIGKFPNLLPAAGPAPGNDRKAPGTPPKAYRCRSVARPSEFPSNRGEAGDRPTGERRDDVPMSERDDVRSIVSCRSRH